jgi:CheY-like chemotaxis protein
LSAWKSNGGIPFAAFDSYRLPSFGRAPLRTYEGGVLGSLNSDQMRRKILVVEDEPLVRDFIARALDRMGYETIAAADGRQACDLFRQHAAELALLWVELALPRLNGTQFIRTLPTLEPRIPVVFTSDEVELHAGEGLPGPLLRKPFGAVDLRRIVLNVLGGTLN